MQTTSRDLQGFAVLLIALLAGGFLLFRNIQPVILYAVPGPTATATSKDSSWEQVIQNELVNGATSIPTRDVATVEFVPPTLQPAQGTPILFEPTQVFQVITPTATRSLPVTATRPGPTAVASPTSQIEVVSNNRPGDGQFSPPPEIVPLSKDPRDHFYFERPVDSSANSTSIYWYTYGSDGPQNEWRIHHGLDMPNPIGKTIRAAGPGRVIWAADHYLWREPGLTDRAYTYGNVVIIEHDFGYRGQPIYTLYAHLSVIMVQVNQHVNTGDTVGLSGESGQVTGPHVHFEVRIGRNWYFNTRNPILWMAPYLNHGVVAGSILSSDGSAVQDSTVSLWQAGRVIDTTTTYVNPYHAGIQSFDVNGDDSWHENFVFGDVPAGDYQVVVTVFGFRITRDVTVTPGTTSFVDMGEVPAGSVLGASATPQS
jgi:murein DD-endopeptidase MepM/ murein hydrolase activator NlpD